MAYAFSPILWLLRRVVAGGSAVITTGLIGLIRGYQVAIAPLLIGSCKFSPTCSEYCIETVRTHGCVRGALMGMWRICRCHPFSAGGLDPVPPRGRSTHVDQPPSME
jgi:putative membrane protein insertion efficiency factor